MITISLIEAIQDEDFCLVKKILGEGVSPNFSFEGWSALHWATQTGNQIIVGLVLDSGADPNAEDDSGITPLSLSVGENNLKITRILLEKGANSNKTIEAYEGGRVIHLASSYGFTEMVKLLVEIGGADLNAVDGEGRTALDFAIDADAKDILSYIMKKVGP